MQGKEQFLPRLKSRVSLLKVMKDLISRRKAIETLNDHQNEYDEYYKGLGKAKSLIDDLPTEDSPLSHIEMLECVEECGPYKRPRVVLFNKNNLTADEAFHFVRSGEYNDNVLILDKSQWISLFKNGVEKESENKNQLRKN